MKRFEFLRPASLEVAARALGEEKNAVLKAGGVDLLDRMKERVDEPDQVVGLVDVGGSAREIRVEAGVVHIGALVTLSEIAASEALPPSLRHAAAESASPQIRNVATLGGNLGQHTRCGYYRHRSFPCFKRGDDVCPVRADGGVQDMAGIFGNDPCACAHPSSLAPVLGSLGATVYVQRAGGEAPHAMPFAELWAAPQKGKASDMTLSPSDVIASVAFPSASAGTAYEEIRQKAAFDWALASAAVRLRVANGKIAEASVWLGAVAPTPIRATAAEAVLMGATPSDALAVKAADAAANGATPLAGTRYKVQLVKAAVRRAVLRAGEEA